MLASLLYSNGVKGVQNIGVFSVPFFNGMQWIVLLSYSVNLLMLIEDERYLHNNIYDQIAPGRIRTKISLIDWNVRADLCNFSNRLRNSIIVD